VGEGLDLELELLSAARRAGSLFRRRGHASYRCST
jgi:hypothetical protein